MSAKPSLLILAAGLGSRYGGFKQIDPIGPQGEIIIDYSIFDAVRAGFGRIVLVTVPELEPVLREHFARTLGDAVELVFVFQNLADLPAPYSLPPERKKPWGTAHAIRAAREVIDGPFGVINADDFYGPQSYRVLHDALVNPERGADYCMVGFELAKTLSHHGTVSRGICRADGQGNLVDVVEHTVIEPDPEHPGEARSKDAAGNWQPLSGQSITSMNLWGFDASIFGYLEEGFAAFLEKGIAELKSEYFIPSVVDQLIAQGRVRCRVLRSGEQWFGMTYQEDRQLAAQAVRDLTATGVYPEALRITVP